VYKMKELKKRTRSTKLQSDEETALIRNDAEGSMVEMEETGYGSKAGAASLREGERNEEHWQVGF
jgi:hypothetical protein